MSFLLLPVIIKSIQRLFLTLTFVMLDGDSDISSRLLAAKEAFKNRMMSSSFLRRLFSAMDVGGAQTRSVDERRRRAHWAAAREWLDLMTALFEQSPTEFR